MTRERVTKWTLDHSEGTQVSLGESQEREMRERGQRESGRCPGWGCHFSCWFDLEGRDPVMLSLASSMARVPNSQAVDQYLCIAC